jgi:glycolate oxidase iron-sulfur subunit
MMQIALGARERGLHLRIVHPVQLLDEAYRAGGHYALPAPTTRSRPQRSGVLVACVGIGIVLGILLARRGRRRR